MATPTNSRAERLTYSGKEEDFPAFLEQFEARIYVLNLSDCLFNKIVTIAASSDETPAEKTKREKE